tara:strand:+ start:65 stop:316 length:252 start_codon:yes stop_codon:yes gene_type:complete
MKRKMIKIEDFEVHELAVREMLPIMKIMGEDTEEGQMHLLGAAVKINGEPIGVENVEELGMSSYMKLVTAVAELNGLDASGND